MNTKCFKTKSEIMEKKMPRINGNNQYKSKTIIALDIGYSSVKGVSPNKLFMFPAFAKLAPEGLEVVGKARADDLQLRFNQTGETWVVGRTAEMLMDQQDIDSTTDVSLYTRYRYDSPIFKAIAATGMALSLVATGKNDEVFLQTGLPATYKEEDEEQFKEALAGDYDVSIKIGSNPWCSLKFSLPLSNIDVMEQPQGTLCSCIYDNGNVSSEGWNLLQSKGTIILDIGFGTEDIYSTRSGYKNDHQTYSDTGMRAVFEQVTKDIERGYKEANGCSSVPHIKIFELQNSLESGVISWFDTKKFATEDIEYGKYLEDANTNLCKKSIKRLMQMYNNLSGYEYLIVTGGTGESRFKQISEMLSGVKHLKVIPGNLNTPDVPFAYSNVIGYYMLRHAQFQAEVRKLESK